MKQLLVYLVIFFIPFQSWGQEKVTDRITPPAGYVRETCDVNSFDYYLRNLSLLPKGSKVLLYNGQEKQNQSSAFAVVDMEIGNRDLQQCADAIIRLRAEYLWKHQRYDEIKFNFTNGFIAEYNKWAQGNRIKVTGNKVQWYASGKVNDSSYKTFRDFLNIVFMYAGTASLSKELQTVPYSSLQPGDIFIKGGSPGHAVIVIDVAIHPSTKNKMYLLAQSYMPAQQIHILVNPLSSKLSPWYELTETDNGKLYTPEWTFEKRDLKRFK